MTKFFHIVQIHPVENGEPNLYKVEFEREFETKVGADMFIRAYNGSCPEQGEDIAVYVGMVNDETGELV